VDPADAECTDVFIRGDAAAGAFGFAHNEDGEVSLGQYAYFVNASFAASGGGSGGAAAVPADPSYFAFHYPATAAGHAFGFNAHGVALSMNAVYPGHVDPDGAGCYFLSRDMLAASGPADAVARATAPPNGVRKWAYGTSINVGVGVGGVGGGGGGGGAGKAGKAGKAAGAAAVRGAAAQAAAPRAFNIEVAPPNLVSAPLSQEAQRFSYHMNLYLRLNVTQRDEPSSAPRRRAARAMCEGGGGGGGAGGGGAPPASVDGLRRVLGDTSDAQWPLYRDGTPPDDSATAATALFDLGARRLHVYIATNPRTSAPPAMTLEIPAPTGEPSW
jgi:hypothetical protein